MFLNNYSVKITPGAENSDGYVVLRHDTKYKITLRNNNRTKCEASIYIDGKLQGTWIIDYSSAVTIERPVDEARKFTFYQTGTPEADQAELSSVDSYELGLIKVVFVPEKLPAIVPLKKHVLIPEIGGTSVNDGWKPYPASWLIDNDTRFDFYGRLTKNENPDGHRSLISQASCYSAAVADFAPGGTGLSDPSDQQFITVPGLNKDFSKITTIYLRLVVANQPPKKKATAIPPPIRNY